MRLDSARFVIRPRGILESLDLAFLFCGRHWWGLLIATALGVGPLMLMNTLVSFNTDEGNLIVLLLMLAQAPWATVWITLYLGQITFSERFSLGLAWRMFWRGWLQLFCFQGIIRTLCMVIWILAPVSYVSLYYMNQIILLEQTPLSRTWARRTALNKRNLGSILSLIAVELIVFAIGVFVLTQILNAISSLWRSFFTVGVLSGHRTAGLGLATTSPVGSSTRVVDLIKLYHRLAIHHVFGLSRSSRRLGCRAGNALPSPDLPIVGDELMPCIFLLLCLALSQATASQPVTTENDAVLREVANRKFPWLDAEKQVFIPLQPPSSPPPPPQDTAVNQPSAD